jgi:hypothetical protein
MEDQDPVRILQDNKLTFCSKIWSWWTHMLSHDLPRPEGSNQGNYCLCTSRDCDRTWIRYKVGHAMRGFKLVNKKMCKWCIMWDHLSSGMVKKLYYTLYTNP